MDASLAIRTNCPLRTTARLLRDHGFAGMLAAPARHDDEVQELREAGVDTAVNLAVEAGAGFARHALEAAAGERGVSS